MGKFWTHINLASPMPNPIFEEPIRRLLGLRQKDLMDIVAGRQELNGKTGGEAIQSALQGLDIDTEIAKHKGNMMKYRGSNRDNAVKALGYLTSAKKQGVHPTDWIISKVPVLPPVFRPVSRLGDLTLEADLNELYRDLVEVNNNIGELRQSMPDKSLHEEKEKMYHALSAVVGLGDPITAEGRSKRLSGAVRTVIGTSPKFGFFQSRVIAKPVDMVGRGVVTPDPNLDMDSIGIPENSAWQLYKNFVIRKLVQQNIPAHKALEMIDKRDPQAASVLHDEMAHRPVIVDRAPTWHKFNLLAFYPHIVKGDTVRVSPLITKGFTMDFDGDAVNFHVPVSDKAVGQTKEKMLPSKNLFSLTDLHSVRHSPQQELALGLYMLTRKASKKPVQRFASVAEAKRAYNAGKIDANDPIEIMG
jgi:DNA-directed RNA polymerase beta' subunit